MVSAQAAPAPSPVPAPTGQVAPEPAAEPAPAAAPPAAAVVVAPPPAAAAPSPPPGSPFPPPAPPPGYAQPSYDARYGYYPPGPYRDARPRLSKGMMITGISILGGSYGLSLLIALAVSGESEAECTDCSDVGPPLFLPVFGPFIAAGEADGGGGVLAMLGVAQLVGAGLMIGGIIKYKNSKQRAREQGYVVELGDGKSLALDVSTSRELTGPRMQLSF